MKKNINYSELNNEIKIEIQKFVEDNRGSSPDMTIEDATLLWFEQSFEDWMLKRYNRERKSKRKHFRFDIEIPVRVIERLIDSDTPESEELDFVGTILNISRGGFYFRSAESFNPLSIIKVVIDLSSVDRELGEVEALAMVVRNDRLPRGRNGVGVMFSSIYDDDRHNLNVFIFKNVAYHLSAGDQS